MTRSAAGSVHGRPSPLKGWVGAHKVTAALLSVLVVAALAIGIFLAVGGSGGTPATTTASTSHRAGPTFILPETAAATKGAKWLTGPAGKLLTAVNADIGKLSTAERAGKQDAAKIAGTQLATDAKAALNGPMPPVDAKVYQSALEALVRAGTSAANGNLSKVAHPLNVGLTGITEVTATANRPPAHGAPTSANEGSGE
jgi:hypothetical protein